MERRPIIVISLILIALLIFGSLGYFVYRQFFGGAGTITVWTVQGSEEAVKQVAKVFTDKNPSYKVKIVPLPEQSYEFMSLYALASQSGTTKLPAPDVWIIPNEWMALHRNKLVAAPAGALDSGIQGYKRERPKGEAAPAWPAKGRSNTDVLAQDYGPIVSQDLVLDSQAWGVPLNMDTLALFYDRTKVSTPPKTWRDVVDASKRFTTRSGNTVTRSTIALGDNLSVAHDLDILSILMLQNGTKMLDDTGKTATFNISQTGATPSGTSSLDFYTSFARPGKETYTWNRSIGTSIEALKNEKTLMAIGYLGDLATLGPILQTKVAVAPLPQVNPDDPQTYGRYLVATVTKQAEGTRNLTTKQKGVKAWELVSLFANPDISEQYATTLRQVPARIDVAKRLTLGAHYTPFLQQVGQAVTWQKADPSVADGALNESLELVLKKNENPQVALDVASKAYTTFLHRETGIEMDPDVLSLWQSSDDATDYREPVRAFLSARKDIKRVAISQHDPERFEWEALNTMAARLGPDILALPNDLVARYAPLLHAFPEGTFNQSNNSLNDLQELRKVYAPAVETDNVIDGELYGMPAHFETLMLAINNDMVESLIEEMSVNENEEFFRNQDLFSLGPLLWNDIKSMVPLAVKRNGATVDRALIALGTGDNVEHAADIYAVLTKQYGGELSDPDRLVTGIHLPVSSRNATVPGQQSLDFITNFASPQSATYTWNKSMPNSLEAFAQGKAFMAFIYPRDIPKMQAINPSLRYKLAPLPQLSETSDPIDFASYFSLTLPLGGKKPNESLEFVQSTILEDLGEDYTPPFKDAEDVAVQDRAGRDDPQNFQRTTAQSYYKGRYPNDVDAILEDLLDKSVNLTQAAQRINQSLKRGIL